MCFPFPRRHFQVPAVSFRGSKQRFFLLSPPTAFSLFKAAMVQSLRRWKLDFLPKQCPLHRCFFQMILNNPEKNPWVFSGIFSKQIHNTFRFLSHTFFFRSRDGSKWHLNHSTFFNFQAFHWACRLSPLNLFRGFPPRTKGIACGGFGGRRSWSYVHRKFEMTGEIETPSDQCYHSKKKRLAHWWPSNVKVEQAESPRLLQFSAESMENVLASVPNTFARLFLCSCFLQYIGWNSMSLFA